MKKTFRGKNSDDRSLTNADFKLMRPAHEVEPELAAMSLRRNRARKGEPTKRAISIRLSPRVLSYFKSKGAGWQTRIDRALEAFVIANE